MKVNVLGTEYTVEITRREDDKKLENADGYCDYTVKKIVCVDYKTDVGDNIDALEDLDKAKNRVLRHETVHAFIYESGLYSEVSWTYSEELVDWIALQFEKMHKAFESIGAI